MISNFIRKYKIKAQKFLTIILLTIIEIILILWLNDWVFTKVMFAPFIQFVMMFEQKDVWSKLTEKEKEEILLSETDVSKFVEAIKNWLKSGKSVQDIKDLLKKKD